MKAVVDAWCYIIMAVPIVTNLNDVMLSGCTCDYSDRVDRDGSGLVSVMAMHIVICFLTMLRYIAILHTLYSYPSYATCLNVIYVTESDKIRLMTLFDFSL